MTTTINVRRYLCFGLAVILTLLACATGRPSGAVTPEPGDTTFTTAPITASDVGVYTDTVTDTLLKPDGTVASTTTLPVETETVTTSGITWSAAPVPGAIRATNSGGDGQFYGTTQSSAGCRDVAHTVKKEDMFHVSTIYSVKFTRHFCWKNLTVYGYSARYSILACDNPWECNKDPNRWSSYMYDYFYNTTGTHVANSGNHATLGLRCDENLKIGSKHNYPHEEMYGHGDGTWYIHAYNH